MSDSINLRQLSPDTYAALERLSADMDWPDWQGYMEPEWVAWLTYRLEFVEDNEKTFPLGKWATIQRLQELVREQARKDAQT